QLPSIAWSRVWRWQMAPLPLSGRQDDRQDDRNFIDIRPELSIALCPHRLRGWPPMHESGAPREISPRVAEHRATGRRRSDRIVGSSRLIQDVIEQAVAAAASGLFVRISGPPGCGKEQIARAIHGWSAQATGPIEVISCVGIPEALRGRELFGCAE